MVKGILVNVENSEVEIVTFDNTLENMYKLLNCDCIDIVRRKVGSAIVDIVCDDESLLKEPRKVSAVGPGKTVMFVGNILVVGLPDEGEMTCLTDAEIAEVMNNVIYALYANGESNPVLKNVDYV